MQLLTDIQFSDLNMVKQQGSTVTLHMVNPMISR